MSTPKLSVVALGAFCWSILTLPFVLVNRVRRAVSENTEVFQGDSLGKTPDG